MKTEKTRAKLTAMLSLLILTHTTVTLLTEAPKPTKDSEDRTLCNENGESTPTTSLSDSEPALVEDRKLNEGGQLSYEKSREVTDSREESPLNKISDTNKDKYGEMDIIVNDIKQVWFALFFFENLDIDFF